MKIQDMEIIAQIEQQENIAIEKKHFNFLYYYLVGSIPQRAKN